MERTSGFFSLDVRGCGDSTGGWALLVTLGDDCFLVVDLRDWGCVGKVGE